MIPRPHNPRINDPVRVRGINFDDLLIAAVSLMFVLILLSGLNIYFNFMGLGTVSVIVLIYVGIVIGLKYTNKQNHPKFLLSFLSFHLFQPKKVTFYYPKPGKKSL